MKKKIFPLSLATGIILALMGIIQPIRSAHALQCFDAQNQPVPCEKDKKKKPTDVPPTVDPALANAPTPEPSGITDPDLCLGPACLPGGAKPAVLGFIRDPNSEAGLAIGAALGLLAGLTICRFRRAHPGVAGGGLDSFGTNKGDGGKGGKGGKGGLAGANKVPSPYGELPQKDSGKGAKGSLADAGKVGTGKELGKPQDPPEDSGGGSAGSGKGVSSATSHTETGTPLPPKK